MSDRLTLKLKQRFIAGFFVVLFATWFLLSAEWKSTYMPCVTFIHQIKSITSCRNTDNFPKYVKNDSFEDIQKYLKIIRNPKKVQNFEKIIIRSNRNEDNPTLAYMMDYQINPNDTNFNKFQHLISKEHVYGESDQIVPLLLHDMATLPIVRVENKVFGTQLKLTIYYSNGMFALFKPQRTTKETGTLEDHFYFQDFERHNSEIAGFHLDRILNFRRTIPTVGRRINMTSEIRDVAPHEIKKTFYLSPANNVCFWTNCSYYCNAFEPVCGNGDMLEGSFAAFLPEFIEGFVWEHEHPWKRSYSFHEQADWENDSSYCELVRLQPLYQHDGGRKLLDVMDLAIFDFLMGNLDRHHYEYFTIWENDSTSIYLDNGRGFGKPFHDDHSILTPIAQCCLIRETTLKKLLEFQNGPKPLSRLMQESLANDPISPVLWEPHYIALDRRVQIILHEIRSCLQKIIK